MASKKTAKPADDNLDELFSGIGDSKKGAAARPAKTTGGSTKDDILADLESQLGEGTSRPHTPRLKDTVAKRPAAASPAVDDKRKSTDSTGSGRPAFTPSATSSEHQDSERKAPAEQASGGGWWGGILSTASATANAAMERAGAAYKEIQQNEEAKKWTDQVRGFGGLDVGALKNYSDELRARAMPTFTDFLNTIAPPISSHERLSIHITHDLVGYPALDPLIHAVFARVMAQVEGGDLLVVQRGHESGSRKTYDSSAGWRDGPWWRHVESTRQLGLVKGMVEGTKLCRAGAEAYAQEFYSSTGGIEQAKVRATEPLSESNPVRTSDLFLAVQAIETEPEQTLFARTASASAEKESATIQVASEEENTVCFAIFILDPIHEIEYATVSQSVPARWVRWLDATIATDPLSGEAPRTEVNLPDEIRDIIESGAVDPREWIAEWIEETLNLSVGIVAQRYVARRMGVGEGGPVKGKQAEEESQLRGEEARAGIL